MIYVVIILFIVIIVFATCCCILIKGLMTYQNIAEDIKKDFDKAFNLLLDKDKHIELFRIAVMINMMTISAKEQDYEKFTFFYNRLYFLGISKDILDDSDKLVDFFDNCINNKFNIEKGEKPFTYQFILKEEGNV